MALCCASPPSAARPHRRSDRKRFLEIAENQPELLARHSTEAGLIEQSAHLWGKAGQRSLARSALIEAEAQLARALVQIASLPGTAALRREAIKLQVALLNAQMHAKGYGAPDTKASLERARSLIENAEAQGETSGRPLGAVFRPLRFLGRELHSVQRRRDG